MEKYRKADQYYIDYHHREIIAELKKLYKPVAEAFREREKNGEDKDLKYYSLDMEFREKAVLLNRLRQKIIFESMQNDDRRDRLVQANPIPKKVRCNTCGKKMIFNSYMFDIDCLEIRFIFDCKNKHLPRKAVYADGREYNLPQRKCKNCGGTEFTSTKEINGNLLIFIDECKDCHEKETMGLDNSPEEIQPINEQERKQFCTDFQNVDTPIEGLVKLCKIIDDIQKNPKIAYDVDTVKKLNIPEVEKRLKKKLKRHGYKKFNLDKPNMGRNIVVGFSVLGSLQDSALKTKIELRQLLKKFLFKTNWRVMQAKITYRMGYSEGKLKGYETDEDLQTIAGEIHTAKKFKKNEEK